MILFFAGTSDARELAVALQQEGFSILASVVTESAAKELRAQNVQTRVGRLTDTEISEVINEHSIRLVIDASHPFAEEASKNAMKGALKRNVPYIRYERETQLFSHQNIQYVDSYEEAAQVAADRKGTIMLTTGSKTLQIFSERLLHLENTRLLIRLLPTKENMEKCEELGIAQKNIIAIQGPFSKEFNQAMFKQYEVTIMVTKESGKAGSVDEKVEAALELGLDVIIIKRPKIVYGTQYSTYAEILLHVKKEKDHGLFNGI